ILASGLSVQQRYRHGYRQRGAGRHDEHAWLRFEVSGESRGVRNAMPGLYADEIGSRLGPEAKVRRVWKTHPQSGSVVGTVGNRTAPDFIEDDDVVVKQ